MDPEILFLVALSMVKSIGPVTGRNLIAACGNPGQVFKTSKSRLMRVPGVGRKTADAVLESKTLSKAEEEINFCLRRNIEVLSYTSSAYPESLAHIFASPLVIYKKGVFNLNQLPGVAIVGTRSPTGYGREMARHFAKEFVLNGINVVSGLAMGIDAEAHQAVIDAGGTTTGILGHGLDRIYPARNKLLARLMVENGALVTEFCRGTEPEACNFPARNRIISGLAHAVIVIEAAATGGALITARFAFDQNRHVYAIPGQVGSPFSNGCNFLIRDDIARLVTSPEEVLKDLQLVLGKKKILIEEERKIPRQPRHPVSNEERMILKQLEKGDQPIDIISALTGIQMGNLLGLLLALEIKSMVKQLPGKKFGIV